MSVIAWLVPGLMAGLIAGTLVNRTGEGVVIAIILGIVGAVAGGFLFSVADGASIASFNIYSVIVAFIGAIVMLVFYYAVSSRRMV
jgi:uncharacterized membrane protein YeaQ/YmgE (transglycosylase-associated protein family)